jgi:hypothetical protein
MLAFVVVHLIVAALNLLTLNSLLGVGSRGCRSSRQASAQWAASLG